MLYTHAKKCHRSVGHNIRRVVFTQGGNLLLDGLYVTETLPDTCSTGIDSYTDDVSGSTVTA